MYLYCCYAVVCSNYMYPLAYVSIICAYSNTYVLVMLAVLSKLCTITYSNIHTHTALYSHHNTVKKPLIA